MERASRSDLLTTINQQKDQLVLYKTKLRDVVAAYKSITKEKEALEASVAVLSASDQSDGASQQDDSSEKGDPLQVESFDPLTANVQKDELMSLKNQIKTLSSSLTTLTQEKNKLESNFIADKKQMKQDMEDLQLRLSEEKQQISLQTEGFEIQVTDLKSRLRSQQLEREKDQTNHSLMLKELQELVTMERVKKEQLMIQLEETKKLWRESEESIANTPSVSEVYEHQIAELQKELTFVRDQIKAAEIKSNQPSPFVLELQQEMGRVKENHQRQIVQEKIKASESEITLKSLAKQSEDRVSSLEDKLSELSHSVGNYERLRYQDQQQISKLRERVTQLDLENTALVHAANQAHGNAGSKQESVNADKVVDQIMHLRDVLISASDKHIKLSNIFVKDLKKSDEELSSVKHYKNELEKVKNEFERYKSRTQSALQTKNKDNSQSTDIEMLKEQNLELRSKLRMSISQSQEENYQFQMKVDDLQKTLSTKEDEMKIEILRLKSSHQKEISQLEFEIKKQRERTIAMLDEKEHEFRNISERRDFGGVFSTTTNLNMSHSATTKKTTEVYDHATEYSEEMKAVNKLLNLPAESDSDAAYVHFYQEKARTDVEISGLRKQKRELETAIRENNALAKQKEFQLQEEITALKDHRGEMERQSYREGANLEYLKNVLLKFLTSIDADGKKQMMKALMTILQFSPQERKKVQEISSKGWWVS